MLIRFLCEKLTRDKTQDRYRTDGGALETRTLNDAEFSRELNKKLLEETNEVIQAKNRSELIAELADVQEVLRAIAAFNQIELAEIETIRVEKVEKRGAYTKRLYSSVGTVLNDTFLGRYVLSDPKHYPLLQNEILNRTLQVNTGAWKRFFGELKNDIMLTLPEYVVSIIHIGTTALKEIQAQPTVDILAAVTSLLDFDLNSRSLMRHGWLPRGEQGINNRRMFVKLDTHNGQEIAHLHCFEHTDPNVKNFVQFTNMLKESAQLREEYTALRQEFLNASTTTYAEYEARKRTFIQKTLN